MEMVSEQLIEASRESVWLALNDTYILQQAMPGCKSFEETGENTFEAKLVTKIGPVKARFKFDVTLSDLDPPRGYTISGVGQGGAAGFAKGAAKVTLSEQAGATVLAYSVQANVGGKLAQLGARLIDGVAKKMADEFFENFEQLVGAKAEPASDALEQEGDKS